jgi:hypothetical protein
MDEAQDQSALLPLRPWRRPGGSGWPGSACHYRKMRLQSPVYSNNMTKTSQTSTMAAHAIEKSNCEISRLMVSESAPGQKGSCALRRPAWLEDCLTPSAWLRCRIALHNLKDRSALTCPLVYTTSPARLGGNQDDQKKVDGGGGAKARCHGEKWRRSEGDRLRAESINRICSTQGVLAEHLHPAPRSVAGLCGLHSTRNIAAPIVAARPRHASAAPACESHRNAAGPPGW